MFNCKCRGVKLQHTCNPTVARRQTLSEALLAKRLGVDAFSFLDVAWKLKGKKSVAQVNLKVNSWYKFHFDHLHFTIQ